MSGNGDRAYVVACWKIVFGMVQNIVAMKNLTKMWIKTYPSGRHKIWNRWVDANKFGCTLTSKI